MSKVTTLKVGGSGCVTTPVVILGSAALKKKSILKLLNPALYVCKNLILKKRVILNSALIRYWAPPSGLSPLHLRGRLQHRATLCVYGAVWLFLSKGVPGQRAECGWHLGTQPSCGSHCILQPLLPDLRVITVTIKSTCTVAAHSRLQVFAVAFIVAT